MTPIAEYSSVVPAAQQASANGGAVSGLNSFLNGLSGLVKPVADIVNAIQAPKYQYTTQTGDGQKAPTPAIGGAPATVGGIETKYLVMGGAAVIGLIALLALTRSK